jgi:hypothetical protein
MNDVHLVRTKRARQPDSAQNVWEGRDPVSALPLLWRGVQRTEEYCVVKYESFGGKGGRGG